ncbi:MAG: hypothetical protein IID60_12505, partial [Proteobacteria bacterium]|nr:hypothetical protein [Pseudomonadota bacterium]
MNRKNLTAAVLAGLAGIAGIAGTAQAVNLNPDGVGQVLIYPYYTTNGGNQTIFSVVNTTDNAKAVKVRFLEGFNSREVLDFNLYLSAFDVWVAAIADDAGTPTLFIPDDSCTVPYLYGDFDGKQAFLSIAYNDNVSFDNDGGPTGIDRAAEGHFEMIEMGTLVGASALDATHVLHEILDDIDFHDGHETHDHDDHTVVDSFWAPGDCHQLVDNWTFNHDDHNGLDDLDDGVWTFDQDFHIGRNSGGLFGGAAIVNAENGTMYSYNALAIQGYDKTDGERHEMPGTSLPSLNSGQGTGGITGADESAWQAWVFFGVPQNKAVPLQYDRGVDAISAVFMHETLVNEYTLSEALSASTEWVITFPTKAFYVDEAFVFDLGEWIPDEDDSGCGGWEPGDTFPTTKPIGGDDIDGPGPWGNVTTDPAFDWSECSYVFEADIDPRAPC